MPDIYELERRLEDLEKRAAVLVNDIQSGRFYLRHGSLHRTGGEDPITAASPVGPGSVPGEGGQTAVRLKDATFSVLATDSGGSVRGEYTFVFHRHFPDPGSRVNEAVLKVDLSSELSGTARGVGLGTLRYSVTHADVNKTVSGGIRNRVFRWDGTSLGHVVLGTDVTYTPTGALQLTVGVMSSPIGVYVFVSSGTITDPCRIHGTLTLSIATL